MPIIIPISDLEPPWFKIYRGKRKKAPKLDTVNKLAKAMVINVELYNMKSLHENLLVAILSDNYPF
jgi:hypothetical protein